MYHMNTIVVLVVELETESSSRLKHVLDLDGTGSEMMLAEGLMFDEDPKVGSRRDKTPALEKIR